MAWRGDDTSLTRAYVHRVVVLHEVHGNLALTAREQHYVDAIRLTLGNNTLKETVVVAVHVDRYLPNRVQQLRDS